MADEYFYNQPGNQGSAPVGGTPANGAPISGASYDPQSQRPATSAPPHAVPYNASTARQRARSQAPIQPPAPDFDAMPSGKRTSPGVVIGVVVGIIALVSVLGIGVNALVSRAVNDFANNIQGQFAPTLPQDEGGGTWGDGWSDQYDFDWEGIEGIEDFEDLFNYYHDFNGNGGSGAAPKSTDPAADDGELHDGWNPNVGYSYEEGTYTYSASKEHIAAYDADFFIDFYVTYPQLEGNLEHKDAINKIISDEALSFVNQAYLEPDADFVKMVKGLIAQSGSQGTGSGSGLDLPFLTQSLEYAITYNSENLVSIVFSDSYWVVNAPFLRSRTLNINLQTGEAYAIDDVMNVTEQMADHWIKNMESSADTADIVTGIGRDVLKDAIMGKGDKASRITTGFFVDANGKVNFMVDWWLDETEGGSRGWWDVTLTDEEVAAAKKDSGFWAALG